MFNSITFYIILGLSIATASFGYISYTLSDDLAVAKQSLKEQENVVLSLQKAAKQQEISCRIDDTDVATVEADKKLLQARVDDITQQMANLKSGIKQSSINATKGTNNVQTNSKLDGSELLSDDLRKLLDSSFCSTEPTDCSIPTGQSTPIPMQSSSSR